MNLKPIIQGEISQEERNKYHIVKLMESRKMVLINLLAGKKWRCRCGEQTCGHLFFFKYPRINLLFCCETKWSEMSFFMHVFQRWYHEMVRRSESDEQLSGQASGWGQMSFGLFVLILECFGWDVKGSSSQAEDCGEFRHTFGPRARRTWFSSWDQWPTSCVGKSVRLPEPPCFLLWG